MENGLRNPLLDSTIPEEEEYEDKYLDPSLKGVPTTDFATAGFWGIASFKWLDSLLDKGKEKAISKDDVPLLSREHRADKLYEKFVANWPKQQEPNSVRKTLVKTYWKDFLLTSFLAFCRLLVLFVGPVLIQSFVQVTSGNESFPYEGLLLVLILFLAKTTEVTTSHVYQFFCQKLGIQVRSSLISTVYRKGLRLSSFARQSHGVGQIINYMSVDVQQLGDSCIQLNNVWLVPCQLVVAMIILFSVTGVSAFAGLVVLILSGAMTTGVATKLQDFQKGFMLSRDKRLQVTVESLNNMKIIKLQAWDQKFLDNVAGARQREYNSLAKFMYTVAWNTFTLWLTPLATSVAIFTCTYLMGRNLSSTMAFTTISTVKIVQEPLRTFPQCLIAVSQCRISLERLERYLWSDELKSDAVQKLPLGASEWAVSVEDGTFKWGADLETPNLHDIDLHVKPGSMVAVVGKVGMGKSSLLAALLGEMTKLSGTVKTCGSTAYVSQQAWIQTGTIQDNILFGQPLDKVKYDATVSKCALDADLAQMEFGDQTEIGERGINLSGGQKQRIQLARAVYQDCDIYFLDDIFSAVDAHTGSALFRDCIVGALAGKTVVLVTHQIDFLPGADLIVVLRDGRIVQSGHYEDLLTGGTDFEALVGATNEAFDKVQPHETFETQESFEPQDPEPLILEQPLPTSYQAKSPSFSRSSSSRRSGDGFGRSLSTKRSAADVNQDEKGSAQLTQAEEREVGRVSWSVYWEYFTRAYGGLLIIFLLLIQVAWQGLQIGGDYWVAYGSTPEGEENSQTARFVVVYAILAFSCGITVFIRAVLLAYIGLFTAQSFYLGMLRSLFRAPMSFFDTTPSGRILSRASTDQSNTDIQIPVWSNGVLGIGFQLLGVLAVTMNITWEIVILLIPLGIAYYKYQKTYFATARELTRVDGLTQAPVINHFSETIAGFVTVRSFQRQDRFIQVNMDTIDSNLRMPFHYQASTEWVGLRMELIGILIYCCSTLVLVLLPVGYIASELVGLCLTYGMNLNGSLFVVAWMYCQLENKMVSVERIGQYSNLPAEAELSIEKTRPPSSWPNTGRIVLQHLKLRYRPQTPLVLKGIDLTITGGHKVGVVGRTGSGKSTLILALFRLVEAADGKVIIDDVDISTLGLNDLRSRLSIIPQDPTLFDGTVRSNIDPLGEYSDDDIWKALEKCQLAGSIKAQEGKLDAPVLENGENWSLGQRQLFCLGRVLLKHSQILVLDEATASVDAETDAIMQTIIRQEFDDCTVISIAHRIPTVMDSDKVLVLDAGRVQEYGSPSKLLDNPKSLFSSLVNEYTQRSVSYGDLVSDANVDE
ncbi:unnamed protein product [Calypogeia fissa]